MAKRLDPAEREARRRERARRSFSDAAYRHYDASSGFGSPEEWERLAEALASGRGAYTGPTRPRAASDLDLLGLTAMPTDIRGLVQAFRRSAMRLHPDHGGSTEGFNAMYAAYERLARLYAR